eukprot:5881206-Prymnesium_polylepis.1
MCVRPWPRRSVQHPAPPTWCRPSHAAPRHACGLCAGSGMPAADACSNANGMPAGGLCSKVKGMPACGLCCSYPNGMPAPPGGVGPKLSGTPAPPAAEKAAGVGPKLSGMPPPDAAPQKDAPPPPPKGALPAPTGAEHASGVVCIGWLGWLGVDGASCISVDGAAPQPAACA